MGTLRELRKQNGLTQHQVSQATGIHIATISLYEGGKTPTLSDAISLEKAFSQPIEWHDKTNKEELIASLATLIRRYPAESVIAETERWMRQERVTQLSPGSIITNIAENLKKGTDDVPPLDYS